MNKRDAYVEKMKAQLDEWNAEMDKLVARANAAEADMKLKYNEQIEALRKQREEANQRLRELQSASEAAWESLRAGMETAWEDMSKAVKDAASRFR